jgi:hypothetical protein
MLRSLGVPSRLAAGFAAGEYSVDTAQYVVSEGDLHSWPEVFFPGYGWVEFEPTVSQSELERARGEAAAQEQSEPGVAGADGDGPASADGLALDRLDQFADVEDIQIPADEVPATPWMGYVLLGLAAVAFTIYVTPMRRTFARWTASASRSAGRSVPPIIEEWSAPPFSEAAVAFRRLAPWPTRLGIRLEANATPSERAQAIARVVPERSEAIAAIATGYTSERYGGRSPAKGEPRRAWRLLRPALYRAGFARLVNGISGSDGLTG